MNQTAHLSNLPKTSAHVESDWIPKLKSNENQTLKEIYTQYKVSFTQQIKQKYCLQDEEAKEIFQLCMIVFYDNVMTNKLSSLSVNLNSYLMGIAHNKVYEHYRSEQKNKRSKSAFSSMFTSIIHTDPAHSDINESRLKVIIEAIQHIGDPCRSILQLFYYQNRSLKEITSHFNYKNVNTTKSLKYKCIQRIKKHIQI